MKALTRAAPWVALALALALAPAHAARETGALRVVVSVPPQKYFVSHLGGERVRVESMAGAGQSPHTLDPTPRQVAALMEADLYVRVGMGFEAGLLSRALSARPELVVVDQRDGIDLMPMDEAEEEGEAEGHHHDELDPHVWMSPKLAERQARTIADALTRADPGGAALFAANLAAFEADLRRVDERIAEALQDLPVREFFIFHPSLGYFAKSYGLTQTAVEHAGKEPTPRQLARLIDRARAAGVRVIFVEPHFSAQGAKTLADALGAAVVAVDPLAEDYLANLERVSEALARALHPAGVGEGGR